MKLFKKMKDGGPDSNVTGYWLVEIKSLFSIVLLRFADGSRENYHSHAFHAFSWVMKGKLLEEHMQLKTNHIYPSWIPFITTRQCFHRVTSYGDTWALTFRGPWSKSWAEYSPVTEEIIVLSNGRKELDRYPLANKK